MWSRLVCLWHICWRHQITDEWVKNFFLWNWRVSTKAQKSLLMLTCSCIDIPSWKRCSLHYCIGSLSRNHIPVVGWGCFPVECIQCLFPSTSDAPASTNSGSNTEGTARWKSVIINQCSFFLLLYCLCPSQILLFPNDTEMWAFINWFRWPVVHLKYKK